MDELKPCQLGEARKVLWYCAQFTDNTHWANQYRKALTTICDELDRRAAPENKLTEDQQEADELIRSLISGKDVNPCEWCHTPDKGGETCKGCYLYEDSDRFPSKFTAFSAAPENKPLTLQQLRGMDGEPVWIVLLNIAKQPRREIVTEVHEDGIWMACADDDNDYAAFGLYGKTWLAYARKPEGSETK